MHGALSDLNLSMPVLAAPMAGGPTTAALVVAAAAAGTIGFLAAGYKTPESTDEEIREVRAATPTFGVNLFAPNPVPVDATEFRRYADAIQPVADRYGLDLRTASPVEDDDHWHAKIDLLLTDPVPVVGFTFGVPDVATISALREVGTLTMQTVTSAAEAQRADDAGVDILAVQSSNAGGHWGTMTPDAPPPPLPLDELITAVRAVTKLPLVAAGGLSTPLDVARVLSRGADACMVGTALLRAHESGTSATHRAALADHSRGTPVLTRSFTGRPARGLPNEFITRYDAIAPSGYPALHHLTSPLRKAAAAAGDPELVNLWAGTGYRDATAAPAGDILTALASAS